MKVNEVLVLVVVVFAGAILSETSTKVPSTKFSCKGRPSGYYADVDTGCQIYHMCDSIGRQFSYACPNTTLFQQRMLVCDHWYMVNCSKSEQDYDANLLIGQKDKPFVTEHENHQRTPRPDILSVPLTPDFFKNLKDYKLQYPISGHVSNSISSNDETDSNSIDDLHGHHFNIPTRWSTGYSDIDKYSTTLKPVTEKHNNLNTASSTYPKSIITTKKTNRIPPHTIEISHAGETGHKTRTEHKTTIAPNDLRKNINSTSNSASSPQKSARPSHRPQPSNKNNHQKPKNIQNTSSSTTVSTITKFNDEHFNNAATLKTINKDKANNLVENKVQPDEKKEEPSVFKFINQFVPDDEFKTTVRTVDEIISINKLLPDNQINKDDIPETLTQVAKLNFQHISDVSLSQNETNEISNSKQIKQNKGSINKTDEGNQNKRRFFEVDDSEEFTDNNRVRFKSPARLVLPPKESFSRFPSVTNGPPIYYEWKWAVPAFDLEPPKESAGKNNEVKNSSKKSSTSKSKSSTTDSLKAPVTQRSLDDKTTAGEITNYEPSDYFIPKYVFPLDKAHPGYDENDSYTSFQVKIPHDGSDDEERLPNYGENSLCPQCHPAFVVPGTCKPCVMIRQ